MIVRIPNTAELLLPVQSKTLRYVVAHKAIQKDVGILGSIITNTRYILR